MAEAQGTVVSIEGDFAVVRMDEAGCGRCQELGGCGGANIARMLCAAPRTYRLPNPGRIGIGERVSVVIPEGAVKRGALAAYVAPLLAVFVGALGGERLAGEAGAMIGAATGLVLAWFALRRERSRLDAGGEAAPRIRSRGHDHARAESRSQ